MAIKNIITISREYGSGGRVIGEKLAEKLDIPFYDRKIITMAAEQSGMPEDVFLANDEKTSSNDVRASISAMMNVVMGSFPISDKLFALQSNVIYSAASKGPCVIVGRCADWILREREDVINIFIHAAMADRVKRVHEEYGIASDKAAAEVVKMDKQRAAYYDYYSFEKWGQCNHYDLSINSVIGIENSVKIIEDYLSYRAK